MKTLKIFIPLIILTLPSCNQTGLGILTAAKNLALSPYHGIKSYFSNRQYEKLEEQSHKKSLNSKKIYLSTSTCSPSSLETPPIPEDDRVFFSKMASATRKTICKCRAWGSCSKMLCPCKQLCPSNFDILKRPPLKKRIEDLSKGENSLAFRNSGAEAKSTMKGTSGYCWGHASITSKFNRLAFYNPRKTKMRRDLDLPPGNPKRQRAIEKYKEIIDDIVANKASEIPGFKDLRKFSEHPELEVYIADKVAQSWADNAMSFQGLGSLLSTEPMKREESLDFLSSIIRKIDLNQQPQILFTPKGKGDSPHTLLVSHYRKIEGVPVLCLRDSTDPPSRNYLCQNMMYMEEDGSLYYGKIPLGGVKIAHNDNADTVAQVRSLQKYCAQKKKCPIKE